MQYTEYKPSKLLESYVKCYYTLECNDEAIVEDQAFATGCVEVMFTLRGAQWQTNMNGLFTSTSSIELWGQILKPLPFRVYGASKIFGIRFNSATAGFLLKEDIAVFNNLVVDLSSVVGNSITELQEQLQELQSVNLQVELVDAFLVKRISAQSKTLDQINLVQKIMDELTQKDFFDTISTVAARYGITSRYLQRVFLQHTGLTPKLYSRINRFQKSIVLIGMGNFSLTDITYECGYFDQSHFIREFKSFTGSSPSGFDPENSTAILASPNK